MTEKVNENVIKFPLISDNTMFLDNVKKIQFDDVKLEHNIENVEWIFEQVQTYLCNLGYMTIGNRISEDYLKMIKESLLAYCNAYYGIEHPFDIMIKDIFNQNEDENATD